jgi:hypothetical protein
MCNDETCYDMFPCVSAVLLGVALVLPHVSLHFSATLLGVALVLPHVSLRFSGTSTAPYRTASAQWETGDACQNCLCMQIRLF